MMRAKRVSCVTAVAGVALTALACACSLALTVVSEKDAAVIRGGSYKLCVGPDTCGEDYNCSTANCILACESALRHEQLGIGKNKCIIWPFSTGNDVCWDYWSPCGQYYACPCEWQGSPPEKKCGRIGDPGELYRDDPPKDGHRYHECKVDNPDPPP